MNNIKYPVDVIMGGRKVGTMERNGTISFEDWSTGINIMDSVNSNTLGISYKGANGQPFKDNAVHIGPLGKDEDAKAKARRTQLDKKNGRIL